MNDEYYIVKKTALPDFFEKVIEAREMVNSGTVKDITEAVRLVGISRSTYYKYKDQVFLPSQGDLLKKAVVSMILAHEKGTLSRVLNFLSSYNANILTITQNPPIGGRASVVVSMDISSLTTDISDLMYELDNINGVTSTSLIDIA